MSPWPLQPKIPNKLKLFEKIQKKRRFLSIFLSPPTQKALHDWQLISSISIPRVNTIAQLSKRPKNYSCLKRSHLNLLTWPIFNLLWQIDQIPNYLLPGMADLVIGLIIIKFSSFQHFSKQRPTNSWMETASWWHYQGLNDITRGWMTWRTITNIA